MQNGSSIVSVSIYFPEKANAAWPPVLLHRDNRNIYCEYKDDLSSLSLKINADAEVRFWLTFFFIFIFHFHFFEHGKHTTSSATIYFVLQVICASDIVRISSEFLLLHIHTLKSIKRCNTCDISLMMNGVTGWNWV